MKLDYDFIKNILSAMEQNDSYLIANIDLANVVGIDLKKVEDRNKFIGHIKLLGEGSLIACDNEQVTNFGFVSNPSPSGMTEISRTNYRLTNEGHKFLESLKDDTFFNKCKNFALPTAKEFCKEYIKEKIALLVT